MMNNIWFKLLLVSLFCNAVLVVHGWVSTWQIHKLENVVDNYETEINKLQFQSKVEAEKASQAKKAADHALKMIHVEQNKILQASVSNDCESIIKWARDQAQGLNHA